MANLLLFLLPAILGLLLPQPAAAINVPNNYLLSLQTLPPGNSFSPSLVQGDYRLTMKEDCNLVLSKLSGNISLVLWETNTAGKGKECKLNLDDNGELVIHDGDNVVVWSSKVTSTPLREYAAVLRPDGKLVVYGPAIYEIVIPSTPSPSEGLGHPHRVTNMLFTGQILNYDDNELSAGDSTFVMQNDCNLVLKGGSAVWQSNTSNKGKYCFLRLDGKGQLIVRDDDDKIIWSSKTTSTPGDYVLILTEEPRVVVYGPAIWTAPVPKLEREIRMVTGRKVAK